jgi:hypothetical protein
MKDKWLIRFILICGLYFVIRLAVGQGIYDKIDVGRDYWTLINNYDLQRDTICYVIDCYDYEDTIRYFPEENPWKFYKRRQHTEPQFQKDTIIDNWPDFYIYDYDEVDWGGYGWFYPDDEPIHITADSSFYLQSDSIPYVDTLSQIDFDTAFWYYLEGDTIIPIDSIFGRMVFLIRGGYIRWDNGYWHDYIYHSYRWGEIKSEDVLYFIQKP